MYVLEGQVSHRSQGFLEFQANPAIEEKKKGGVILQFKMCSIKLQYININI